MVSTTGSALLPESATKAYLSHLLPQTTLLTPNLPEALLLAKLAGKDFGKIEELSYENRLALAKFLATKSRWVLLKGGHKAIEKERGKFVVDILVSAEGFSREFISDFSTSTNTHGTGCTLACISFIELD
jgi:hydroxymethylpyrimidine/phosphomethylpyrimidine kinase / thiaminase